MKLTDNVRELVLFVGGLVGIISYVALPSLRDPILLPVYITMLGLPIVINRDKTKKENGTDPPK